MIGIYAIRNKETNKYYIGQSKNIIKRINNHYCSLKNNKHSSKKIQNSFNKYGKECFEHVILEEIQIYNKTLLTELEDKWITFYDSIFNGYNIKKASDVYTLTTEQKLNLSEKHKASGHMPTRAGIEKSAKQKKDKKLEEIYGVDRAKEIKEKISKNNEWYDKKRGKTFEELYGEERGRQMRIELGERSKLFDHGERSDEFKEALSKKNNRYGRIIQKLPDGNIEKIWDSRIELFDQFEKTTIKKCLSGSYKYKTYKGYIWEYEFPPLK